MLEDGLLDAWLMQLFGRSFEIAVASQAILGALLGVSIWYLGIIIFESIPLALISVSCAHESIGRMPSPMCCNQRLVPPTNVVAT